MTEASNFLREISESGRDPTDEEVNSAVKMRRVAEGLSDENLNPNSKYNPYYKPDRSEYGVSAWGQGIENSQENLPPGQTMGEMLGEDIPVKQDGPNIYDNIPTIPETQPVYHTWSTNRAQVDALITGDPSTFSEHERLYSQGVDTVEDELISVLEQRYNDAFIDAGVLENIQDRPQEEQIARIVSEYDRLNSQKEEIRTLVAINMLRQGLGQYPTAALDHVYSQLEPVQVRQLLEQRRSYQLEELNTIVNSIAAEQGVGFTTGAAVNEMVRQDLIPFWGAATRIAGTNKFLPDGIDMNILRKGLPGELRQEVREWWVSASHEDRVNWLQDIEKEWHKVRTGPQAALYTRYLAIENLMGIFTDELLYNDNPKDTFDRVMGNLDTAIGFIIGIGVVAKRGKTVGSLWGGGNASLAKQAAEAGGSRAASESLNAAVKDLADELGMTKADASVPEMVRPQQLEMDFGTPVETDTVIHTTTANQQRRKRILEYSDDAEITLLDDAAKVNAVRKQIEELAQTDTVHVHTKMSTVEVMDNDVGVRITSTVGAQGGEGWVDLGDLMDDMLELDPYQTFTIWRRGKNGKLQQMDITWDEITDYYSSGRIPRAMDEFLDPNTTDDIVRHFGMRRLSKISNEELEAALGNGWLDPGSAAYNRVRHELNERAAKARSGVAEDPLLMVNGEELFVRFKTDHFFEAGDMGDIDGFRLFGVPFAQSPVTFVNRLLPPSLKFGKVYRAAQRSYHMEEATLAEFADILTKFDNLPSTKKREIMDMMDWAEDYAKDMYHETGIARAPTTSELIGEFSHYSEETFEGFLAHREAMEGLYDVLNRRLYREFNNKRYKTMRGTDDRLPSYSGEPMREMQAGQYYDPVKRQMVQLTDEQIAGIKAEGGGAIKLETPMDAPSGKKFTRVLARKGEYEIGDLTRAPLHKYEGYQFRFYEDPYYVVKRTYGAEVDGVKLPSKEYIEEAVRTAPTARAARMSLGQRIIELPNGEFGTTKGNVRWVIKASRQINQTEGTLYQKQSLQGQGRMFWDERNHERLPDVDGNRAKVADPFQSIQRGLALAMRQSTQESLFDSMKIGFKNEFGDLPKMRERGGLIEMEELRDIERSLTEGLRESHAPNTRQKYKEAREYIRYMRTQLGTDTFAVPAIRAWTLSTLKWFDNMLLKGRANRVMGPLERHAMSMDPFARARKIAYGAFMVLRPVRQALLQSSQISMLTGLDPTYIGSGKIFFDAMALRRGLTRYRKAGFDDGWSDSKLAAAMGLSKKEYKRLVEEFQRSGLLGSVNTHAFNASGRNLNARLDPTAGPAGRMMYNVRARGRKVFNALARGGFEWGEMNNLTYTYMVAMRRAKKKFKVDDITKLDRKQWDWVTAEADGLALGMTRPNKFGYQSGATGMMFQFLSFQHRAALTMIGLNPRLKGFEKAKVFLGSYVLWGSNIFGGEDFIREKLASMGMSAWGQQEVLPGQTIQDILVAGVIETGLNGLLNSINEVESDLNIGILAPGAAISEIYQGLFDILTSAPSDMEFLGPFGNQASAFVKGAKFFIAGTQNEFKTPGQNLVETAEFWTKNTLPVLNDIQTVWISAQLGEWVDKEKDTLGIQTSKAALIARGLLGVRPEAETSIYRARQLMWENQQNIDDWVTTWRPVIRQVVDRWIDGEYNDTEAYQRASVILGLTEYAPEGVRQEIFSRLMTDEGPDGKTVTGVVAEASSSATSNIRRLEPHLANDTNLTPEQKKQMQDLIDTIADGYEGGDIQHREIIQGQIDEKRGQQ